MAYFSKIQPRLFFISICWEGVGDKDNLDGCSSSFCIIISA